jgi:GxxExxY protein
MSMGNDEAERSRINELSRICIGLCIEIHRELGPGLLESACEECLAYELSRAELRHNRQIPVPVIYKGVQLNCGYRLDFLIENSLILELKAVGDPNPIYEAQLMRYLKLARMPLGLLINFNVPVLTQGIRRIVWGGLFKDKNQPPKK